MLSTNNESFFLMVDRPFFSTESAAGQGELLYSCVVYRTQLSCGNDKDVVRNALDAVRRGKQIPFKQWISIQAKVKHSRIHLRLTVDNHESFASAASALSPGSCPSTIMNCFRSSQRSWRSSPSTAPYNTAGRS